MRFYIKAILFIITGFLCSCIPNRCKDTVCNYGGVCVDGSCSCLNGYEGLNCSEIWNNRFIGSWNTKDISTTDTLSYTSTLINNGRPDQFLFLNIGNMGDTVVCMRSSYSDFTISATLVIDSTTSIQSCNGYFDSLQHQIIATYEVVKNNVPSTYKIILNQ